jgi:hypothetical protein
MIGVDTLFLWIMPKRRAVLMVPPKLRCARKMCAWDTRHRSPDGSLILARGSLRPRCIPQTRSVAPWTSPDALCLLDFRPGRFHQPLDPRPFGRLRSPPDPHRPGVCRHGPARGLCTLDRTRAFAPMDHDSGRVRPETPKAPKISSHIVFLGLKRPRNQAILYLV